MNKTKTSTVSICRSGRRLEVGRMLLHCLAKLFLLLNHFRLLLIAVLYFWDMYDRIYTRKNVVCLCDSVPLAANMRPGWLSPPHTHSTKAFKSTSPPRPRTTSQRHCAASPYYMLVLLCLLLTNAEGLYCSSTVRAFHGAGGVIFDAQPFDLVFDF
jgi:TRAP-type mannitol/chloroaromatic compound transport system permease large subunit